MILAIDMGNTNIVIGCIDDEKIYFEERIATDLSKTELEYFCLFKTVLELYQIHGDEINGAIISSVVPPLVNVLKDAVEKLIGVTPYIVGSGIRTGLNIVMDNPRQVGSDMIVDAVAAVREYKAPFIVIDIGAAGMVIISGDVLCRESRFRQIPWRQRQHSFPRWILRHRRNASEKIRWTA